MKQEITISLPNMILYKAWPNNSFKINSNTNS
jgi:hypothetical protein